MSEYQRAISALFTRTGSTAKLGLERTRALLSLLGNPEQRIMSFHVAGTNGKGSVVAMLDALLRGKGMRVGRYTSPHLVDFRERIVVDGAQIAEEEVLEFLQRWEPAGERVGATFFELTTVLALDYFARREVDVAVIETGLGGRLDATNVITPLVAGITSISLEHQEYLGDTLRQIAREKAGIFKPGVPAVVGPLPADARDEILRVADESRVSSLMEAAHLYETVSARVSLNGTDLEIARDGEVHGMRLGLVGTAQADNLAVALAMLDAGGPSYSAGLAEAGRVLSALVLPGRFQRIGKIILDVAHNVAGVRSLARTIEALEIQRPMAVVLGVLRDKDWLEMLRVLGSVADAVIATSPFSAPPSRVWNLQDVARDGKFLAGKLLVEPDFAAALSQAQSVGRTVLVTGSFYTVGDCLAGLRFVDGTLSFAGHQPPP